MISDYLANKLLDAVLKNTAYSSPATVYLALFTTPIKRSDNIGTPTEVSGGSYARVAVSFASAAGGLSLSSASVTFPAPTADWGTVVAAAICDASTSGNILFSKNICPQTISNGDAATSFPAKAVKMSFDS